MGNYDLDIACREYDFEKGVSVVVEQGGGVGVWRNEILIAGQGEGETRANGEQREGKGRGQEEVEIRVVRRREWREERGGCESHPLSLRALVWRTELTTYSLASKFAAEPYDFDRYCRPRHRDWDALPIGQQYV